MRGRPTKYKASYCQDLIDHMSKGHSMRSFAGLIEKSPQTIYSWLEKHKEFKKAHEIGMAKCEIFYERLGLNATVGNIPNFQATPYVWMTKNILKWRDSKQDIDLNANVSAEHTHNHEINGLSESQMILLAEKITSQKKKIDESQ